MYIADTNQPIKLTSQKGTLVVQSTKVAGVNMLISILIIRGINIPNTMIDVRITKVLNT
jgi:hypothetical protein